MKRRRVKITGVGPVTPAGVGRDEFWKGILESVSRIRPFHRLGEEFGPFVAAYLDKFRIEDFVDREKLPKGAARHTQFAVAGAILALKDAGLSADQLQEMNCGILTGSSVMDFGGIGSSIEGVQKRGARGAQPRVLYAIGVGSVPSAINEVLGLSARTLGISTQCNSGLDAIGLASDMVARGEIDVAICGGTEAPLHRFPLVELRAAGLTPPTVEMPERLSRPFDLWRTTGVVSEGCCIFVIEPESSPRPGYSFIAGYATAGDPAGDLCGGLSDTATLAMAEARCRPSAIEVINAWGPGHKQVDVGEARAMAKVFHSFLPDIPVVSIKGSIGTPLGGAPAIQMASAVLAQRHGIIPPTVNWDFPDPACPLNLSNQPRLVKHSRTMINAHGLGGVNASVILERCT